MTFRIVIAAAVALVLAACGGSGDSSTTNAAREPLVADGKVNIEAMQARADEFVALSAAEQEAQLASLDGALERELWKVSGLEEALGGPAAADAAFAAHSEEVVAQARAVADQPIVLAAFRQGDAAPTAGAGLFGGMLVASLGAEAVVTASNDFKDGEKASGKLADGVTLSASIEHGEMNVDTTHESNGVTTKLRINVQVDPCPDANGHFEGKARVDVSVTKTGGSTGQNGILDVAVTGQVDDDAKLASSDADYTMQWAKFADGKGSFVEVSGAIGDTKVTGATLGRSAGKVSPELQQDASSIGMLYALLAKTKIAEAAQKGWESGRCVTLKPTAAPGPKGMEPKSTSKISAAPRSRIDGAKVGGTVTATLTAGAASVEPAGSKVPADAKFTYTAPDEENKTGTVALEARSKRGVAKASIDFDTNAAKAYHVAGGLEDFQVNQDVCDITKPFSLNGQVGVAEFSGGLSGTYVATGMFDFRYEGTYVVTLPDGPGKPGTMAATSSGTVAGVDGSGTENYTLTPLKNCS